MSDKFSDAANMADGKMEVDESSDEGGNSVSTSSPSTVNTAYQLRKSMKWAGMEAAPAPPSSSKIGTGNVSDEIHVVILTDRVASLDVISTDVDAASSAFPDAGSAAAANAPPAREPPAARVAGGPSALRALVAEAAKRTASKTLGRGEGGYRQVRKSQAAKQQAASAALKPQLRTTRGFEQTSDSEPTAATTMATE